MYKKKINLSKKIFVSLSAFLLLVVFMAFYPHPLRAQDSTSSSETTKKLKERIERIVEEKRDQIQGAIDNLSQRKQGFIGQVTRVSEEAITIKNSKGTIIVPIDETVALIKGGQDISIDDIAVDNWLLVIGFVEDDTFTPRRILVSTNTLRPRSHLVSLGTIQSLTSSELQIRSRLGDEEINFILSSKTEFQDLEGSEVSQSDFSNDLQVLVVGYQDEDNKRATVIRALATLDDETDN